MRDATTVVIVVILCSAAYTIGISHGLNDTLKDSMVVRLTGKVESLSRETVVSNSTPQVTAVDLAAVNRKIGIVYDAMASIEGRKWEQAVAEAIRIADEAEKNRSVR